MIGCFTLHMATVVSFWRGCHYASVLLFIGVLSGSGVYEV